jgi:hypothetical protein
VQIRLGMLDLSPYSGRGRGYQQILDERGSIDDQPGQGASRSARPSRIRSLAGRPGVDRAASSEPPEKVLARRTGHLLLEQALDVGGQGFAACLRRVPSPSWLAPGAACQGR